MKLENYVNEIFDIAHENNVDVGVAMSMFLTNVELGEDKYHGAPEVDYAALKGSYPTLYTAENLKSYTDSVREHYQEVVALRREGRREEAAALLLGEEEPSEEAAHD